MHPQRLLSMAAAMTCAFGLPFNAYATNGYQLIGVGSYQKSLGGAVTANPKTAMTAISNPAGMTRIGTRADFNMEAFMPDRFVDFAATGGDKQDSSTTLYGVPALGWTAPINDSNKDVFFGGGMYGTSGMGADYASTFFIPQAGSPFANDTYFDGYSSIAFWQMAPTLAWNANKNLSLGISMNIDYQAVAFKQRAMTDTNSDGEADTIVQNFDLSRTAQGFGFGMTFGLLYDASDQFTFGVSYKSKQEFSDMKYQLGRNDILNFPTSNCPSNSCPGGTYRMELDYPQQLATGIAYRPTKKLTISADAKWIDWSDTMSEIKIKGPGSISLALPAGWDDQMIYALGVSYALNDRTNLRAGFNYAQSPFGDDEVSANLILPATVETHYAIGADYRISKYWEVGFHYMYAPEITYTAPLSDPIAPGAKIGLSEQSFGINLGTHF